MKHVTPANVIAALEAAGIRFVLMGAHGINTYRDEARATQDVDVLVTKKDIRKAVRVLEEAFPYLQVTDYETVARFIDPVTQKGLIDVMKPATRTSQLVFRNTVPIGDSYRIPDLEMAVVAKFVAMTAAARRQDKRFLDAGDFTNMILNNRARLDLAKLKRLGDKVRTRAGAEILKLIADLDAGRTIALKRS